MAGGQVMAGDSSSLMVTVNEQPFVLPAPSVATQVTLLVPTAKVDPLGGAQTTVTFVQLSAAVAVQVTLLLLHWPGSFDATIGAGQVMEGG